MTPRRWDLVTSYLAIKPVNHVPAPLLVGIETNPGPENPDMIRPQIYMATSYEHEFRMAAVKMIRYKYRDNPAVSNEMIRILGYFQDPISLRHVYFPVVRWMLSRTYTDYAKACFHLAKLMVVLAFPPAARLVGIELNPGPVVSKPIHSPAYKNESDFIDRMSLMVEQIANEHERRHLSKFSGQMFNVSDMLEKAAARATEKVLESASPSVERAVESFHTIVKEANEEFAVPIDGLSDSFTDGVKKIVEEGIPLKLDFSSFFDYVKGFVTNNPVKTLFEKLTGSIPNIKQLLEVMSAHTDERSKAILCLCVIVTLGWIGNDCNVYIKSAIIALQWAMALQYGDKYVQGCLATIHGVQVMKFLISYIIDEDPIESHSLYLQTLQLHNSDIFTKVCEALVSMATMVTDFGVIKTVLTNCVSFQRYVNGAKFTINTAFEVIHDMFAFLSDTEGLKLFRKTHNKFPDLFLVNDTFLTLENMINKGERVGSGEVQQFTEMVELLENTMKKIPNDNAHGVYQRQVQYLQTSRIRLQHNMAILGCFNKSLKIEGLMWMFIGPTNIGKSQITESCINISAPYIVDDIDKFNANKNDYVNRFMQGSEFQDQMKAGCEYLVIDDWGQTTKAQNPEACIGRITISIVNNAMYFYNMSSLNRKCTVAADPLVILASTNKYTFGAEQFHVIEPKAVTRRFEEHTFVVGIKEKYRLKIDGDAKPLMNYGIDYSVMEDGVPANVKGVWTPKPYIMHKWDIVNQKVIASYEMKEFYAYFVQENVKHINKQRLHLLRMAGMTNNPELNPIINMSFEEVMNLNVTPIPIEEDIARQKQLLPRTDEKKNVKAHATKQQKEVLMYGQMDIPVVKERRVFEDAYKEHIFKLEKEIEFLKKNSGPTDFTFYINAAKQLQFFNFTEPNDRWSSFVSNNFMELMSYYSGDSDAKLIKSALYTIWSPQNIPDDLKKFGYWLEFVYMKFLAIAADTGLAFEEIWGYYRTMSFKESTAMSWQLIKKYISMELRNCRQIALSTFTNFFTFGNFFVNTLLRVIPAVITALVAVQEIIPMSIGRVKIHRVKPKSSTDPPKASVPEIVIGTFEGHSRTPNMNSYNVASSFYKNNQYAACVEVDGQLHFLNNVDFYVGHRALVPGHFVLWAEQQVKEDPNTKLILYRYSTGRTITVLLRHIRAMHSDNDRAIVIFSEKSGLHNHTDMRSNFITDKELSEIKINDEIMIMRVRKCENGDNEKHIIMTRVTVAPKSYICPVTKNEVSISKGIGYIGNFLAGDCGSVVMHNQKIAYLHAAGTRISKDYDKTINKVFQEEDLDLGLSLVNSKEKKVFGYGVPVTQEWLKAMDDIITNKGYPAPAIIDDVGSQHAEVVSHCEIPKTSLIAKVTDEKLNRNTNSSYERTKFSYVLDYPNKWRPAIQFPHRVEVDGVVGDLVNPRYNYLKKYNPEHVPAKNVVGLDFCTQVVKSMICPAVLASKLPEPKVLDFDEITHGCEFGKGVPRSTSEGFHLKLLGVTKAQLFGTGDTRTTDSDQCKVFRAQYELHRQLLRERKGYESVFLNFGKDECLLTEKVLNGKLRLVSSIDLEEYYHGSSLYNYVQYCLEKNPLGTGCVLGMNFASSEWDTMAKICEDYWIVCGDIGGFDTICDPSLFYCANEISEAIFYNSTIEERNARYTYTSMLCNSLHVELFDRYTIYLWITGQSSGSKTTLVFNDFMNMTLLVYLIFMCWCEKMGFDHLEFDPTIHDLPSIEEFVRDFRIFVQGDDHLICIAKHIDWVNHSKIADHASKLGVKYTDELKLTEGVKDLRHISECVFVQRGFRKCETLGRYVSPLSLDSCYRMLYWTDTAELSINQCVDVFVKEMSYHGESEWNLRAMPVIKAAAKLYGYFCPYQSWLQALYAMANSEVRSF